MRLTISAIVLALVPTSWALAVTTTDVSFQQGDANGYTGTFDRRISEESLDANGDPVPGKEFDGSTVTKYSVDGNGTTGTGAHSSDNQILIRFDDIIGSGPGQIPANASILDAKLEFVTGTATNDKTGGPVGVSGLLQAFDSTTSYYTSFNCGGCLLGSRGAWYQDNSATRAVGVAQVLPPDPDADGSSTIPLGKVGSVDVRSLVQQWTDATLPNFGMTLQMGFPGSLDAWAVQSSGNPISLLRPKLSATYTTDPVAVNVIQRDLNGYTSDMSALVRSGADLVGSGDDLTSDGLTLTAATAIDGKDDGVTERSIGLFKFDNVFGAGAGQAPATAPVAKAWFVLTTGQGTESRSPGPFSLHVMNESWDTTTLYSDFGAVPGLTEADGDFGPAIVTTPGNIDGGEIWLDITSYLENIRNGAVDFGLALEAGTNDGWSVLWDGNSTGITHSPRLVIYSDLGTVPAGVLGDFDNNGLVDARDYITWRKNEVANASLPNDNGAGDQAARYALWRMNFSASSLGSGSGLAATAAVPEPASLTLLLVAGLAGCFSFSRKR